MKYVLVTGGVVSGLGKGVTASSIGVILKGCGFRVTTIKIGSHSFPPASSQSVFLGALVLAFRNEKGRRERLLPEKGGISSGKRFDLNRVFLI